MAGLDIIIVNWNVGDHLRTCISSIGHAKSEGFILRNVIIVDNASTDDSLDGVDRLGVSVRIIRNTVNRGFAAACNQGAALAGSEYLLFLNPDTYLFENSLTIPLHFMERAENINVGICGIQLIDEHGSECLSYAAFPDLGRFVVQAMGLDRIPGITGRKTGRQIPANLGVQPVDQVIGAFFIVHRAVYEQLKGFDEHFFVYFEEVDFSMRAHNNGWTSVCLTGAKCAHIGGGSSQQVKAARLFYSLRSRLLYGFKHFSLPSGFILLAVTLVPEFFSRIIFSLAHGAIKDLRDTVYGYFLLLKSLPATLRLAIEMRKSP